MQYTTFSTFRFRYPLYSALAFSKRSSVIFLLMEIIQFITVNADHELQHIVDKGCQSCALIPQQMEYFRNFVLGFEADIYGSPFIGTLYGTENVCSKSGSKIFFRWNPDLSGVVPESAGIVPAAGAGGSVFEPTVLLRIVGSASSCFGPFCATSPIGSSFPRSIFWRAASSISTRLLEECLNVFLSF